LVCAALEVLIGAATLSAGGVPSGLFHAATAKHIARDTASAQTIADKR
jgi:hypothetical protein